MRFQTFARVSLCCVLAAWATIATAAVKLPAVIGDNMVLQRGQPVPIWGWADKGEEVTVAVAGQSLATKADAKGRWKVTLAKLDAGEPLHDDRQRLLRQHAGAEEYSGGRGVGGLRPVEHGDGRRRCKNATGNCRRHVSQDSPVHGDEEQCPAAANRLHRQVGRVQPGHRARLFRRWPISSAATCSRSWACRSE